MAIVKTQYVYPKKKSREAHMSSDYTIWEDHLGMPMHLLNYAFPAWPGPDTVALANIRACEVCFSGIP